MLCCLAQGINQVAELFYIAIRISSLRQQHELQHFMYRYHPFLE